MSSSRRGTEPKLATKRDTSSRICSRSGQGGQEGGQSRQHQAKIALEAAGAAGGRRRVHREVLRGGGAGGAAPLQALRLLHQVAAARLQLSDASRLVRPPCTHHDDNGIFFNHYVELTEIAHAIHHASMSAAREGLTWERSVLPPYRQLRLHLAPQRAKRVRPHQAVLGGRVGTRGGQQQVQAQGGQQGPDAPQGKHALCTVGGWGHRQGRATHTTLK